jgi:chromosome segregation ATPase
VEGLHERLCRELRAQLEQKEAELAQMAAMNAVPRDLHMLRIRVQEELEAPHAQRVAELESRVEYFSADAFDLRSKLEVMKLEYDRTVEERGKDAEEFQRELRRERETLQHHISELQRRLDAQAVDDLPRKLERVKAQLELSEKQWAEENHTVCRCVTVAASLWQRHCGSTFFSSLRARSTAGVVPAAASRCGVVLAPLLARQSLALSVDLSSFRCCW